MDIIDRLINAKNELDNGDLACIKSIIEQEIKRRNCVWNVELRCDLLKQFDEKYGSDWSYSDVNDFVHEQINRLELTTDQVASLVLMLCDGYLLAAMHVMNELITEDRVFGGGVTFTSLPGDKESFLIEEAT